MGEVLEFKKKEGEEMQTISAWWKYDNELSDETIDKILEIGEGQWQTATTLGKDEKTTDKNVRKTDIIWNNEQWLYDLFWGYMVNANQRAGWNLDIECAESFQLGRYTDGGHYDFHIDGDMMGTDTSLSEESLLYGKTRKISMVCWLNEDFEGGEFQFHDSVSRKEGLIKPTKGTIVLFPSFYAHKVHPVTEGTRYSLVTWFQGYPVK